MKQVRIYMIFLGTFLLWPDHGFAQQNISKLFPGTSDKIIWKVKSSSPMGFEFHYKNPGISIERLEGDSFFHLLMTDHFPSTRTGYPDIPVFQNIITIPSPAGYRIFLHVCRDTILSLSTLGVTGRLTRVKASEKKSDSYEYWPKGPMMDFIQTGFYPSSDSIISIQNIGIQRQNALGLLSFFPVQYNEDRRELRIILELEAEISFNSPLPMPEAGFSNELFYPWMGVNFPSGNKRKEALVKTPVSYVILADSMYRSVLQPFIKWKNQKGFRVVELYKGINGTGITREEMKASLKKLYDSATVDQPAPSYLLICGDHEQIPAFYGKSVYYTDLYYAEYDGGTDYLPELYYGRMSAQTPEQLKNQLDKTIEYEQFMMPQAGYLDTVILIAGVDGTYASKWGNGQINYATNAYFNSSQGFYSHTYLYPGSGSKSAEILQRIHKGASVINYTGHGFENRWESPSFTVAHIDTLRNYHKYGLFISNGCKTNLFSYPVCLGEALLRAKEKGGIGHIGATDDTYWDEDFWWSVGVGAITANPEYQNTGLGAYDRWFHTHGESYTDWYTTQSQIIYAGNMAVGQSGSSRLRYYWEAYHLLGDPSLEVYLGMPTAMEVEIPGQVPSYAPDFPVRTEPHAYVGLSCRDTFMAGGFVDSSGLILLPLKDISPGDILDVWISKQNRTPFHTTLQVNHPESPFVVHTAHSLHEIIETGNKGEADYGEDLTVTITLRNAGPEIFLSGTGRLHSEDPFITITDSILSLSSIPPESETSIPSAFRFRIKESCPDGHQVRFRVTITDQKDSSWISWFWIPVKAPDLVLRKFFVEDSLSGNGNGIPNRAEHYTLMCLIQNTGNSPALDAEILLHTNDPWQSLLQPSFIIPVIPAGDSIWISFSAYLDKDCPDGIPLEYSLTIKANQEKNSLLLKRRSNLPDEDFETDRFNRYPWTMEGIPWTITAGNSIDGFFSARSGIIGNSASSSLSLPMLVSQTDTLSFYYKVSSETSYDFLEFYVDGILKLRKSGNQNWTQVKFPVEAGNRQFRWKYIKDGNTAIGEDCGWIDGILFPPGIMQTGTRAALMDILHPIGDSSWNEFEYVQMKAINRGEVPVQIASAGFSLDNSPAIIESLSDILPPGNTLVLNLSTPLHLERYDTYALSGFIQFVGDTILQDDSLRISVTRLPSEKAEVPVENIMLWPNPAHEKIFIYIPLQDAHSILYEIYDLSGRNLHRNKAESNLLSIPVRNFPDGIYVLRVHAGKKVYLQQFAVNHSSVLR